MVLTADQIVSAAKSNLETAQGLATQSFAGFEKLVNLNVTAARALVSESFDHAQALLAAKDAQQFVALNLGQVAPNAEKAVSYGRHVYGIAVETTAEFTKAFEGKVAEGQKVFSQTVENLSKNAPAGTEQAVAAIKTAMASSQSALESAQSAAKQALAMAESNVNAVTEQALNVAGKVAKKASAAA